MYQIFTRTWWKRNPAWPHGKEPCIGRKSVLAHVATAAEAQDICENWNFTNPPGALSRKAEYEAIA